MHACHRIKLAVGTAAQRGMVVCHIHATLPLPMPLQWRHWPTTVALLSWKDPAMS